MKIKLLFIFFLFTSIFQAQIVSIPNATFKARLVAASASNTTAKDLGGNYFKIDANADGEIQVSEALQVSELDISTPPQTGVSIPSIEGIASFTNLVKLNAQYNALVASPYILDLTMLNSLNYINVNNTSVVTLNLGTKTNVETIMVGSSSSTIIYDSPTATLKSFTGKANAFLSINYLKRIALEELHVTDGITFPFDALKYHTNLQILDLDIDMYNVNNIDFTNYNPLDNPIYPNNIKTLITPIFYQGLPVALFHNLESMTFNSVSGPPYLTQVFQPSDFPNLKYLELRRGTELNNSNPIASLDLTPLTHLETFITTGGGELQDYVHETLNTVNFGANTFLKHVEIGSIPFETVDLSGCPNVDYLKINTSDGGQSYPNNLVITLATENQLKELNMYGYIHTSVNTPAMKTTILNLGGSQSLEKVRFVTCEFMNNLVFDSQAFNSFESHTTYFHGMTFGQLPNLTHFWMEGALLGSDAPAVTDDLSLDFSGCTSLGTTGNQLSIAYQKLRYLNLKNGNDEASVEVSNDNLGLKVCIDASDFDNDIFPNGLMGWDLPDNVIVTNYCSYTPNGTFNTLNGKITWDANANGYDASDIGISSIKVKSTVGSENDVTFSNLSGDYEQFLGLGNYNVATLFENPTYFTATPATFAAPFPTTYGNVQTQDISVAAAGIHNDLDITVVPMTHARPGFDAKYKIIYKNKGTTTLSGAATFGYDESKMDFVSATTTTNAQSSGNLSWNFANLGPFQRNEILVTMHLNSSADEVPLNSGDVISYNANVNGGADETLSDNTFALSQNVNNAVDPNDKTCLEGSVIGTAKVGDYVNYMIRFENTGTSEAQNIVVRDMIDLAKFDINSIQPVDASHPLRMTVTGGNKVEFFFENILLPAAPSDSDNGYVVFKIKTKSTLAIGNTFSNSANIYFDYNAPIATNTYMTTIQNLGLDSSVENILKIWPNPVKGELFFSTDTEVTKVEVYDISGRIIRASGVIENKVDLSGLAAGSYIVKAYSQDHIQNFKVIKE